MSLLCSMELVLIEDVRVESARSRTRATIGCCLALSASSWTKASCRRPAFRLVPTPFPTSESSLTAPAQDVNSGDTFQCTLGADPSIRLTFVRTSTTGAVEGGAFAEQFKTTTYHATTTVRNKHRFALERLLVRDSVPLVPAEEKRTRVVLREPSGLADAAPGAEVKIEGAVVRWAKDGEGKSGEKDGKMEWEAKVESGGEVTLVLEYEVRGPAEAFWVLKAE